MRGLWDNEQPISPSLLRSALALVSGLLVLCAIVMLVISFGNVMNGLYVAAAFDVVLGLAVPFALWLGLRMLADILIVLNRSYDRLDAMEEQLAGRAASTPRPTHANGPGMERAGDDGPAYPSEE